MIPMGCICKSFNFKDLPSPAKGQCLARQTACFILRQFHTLVRRAAGFCVSAIIHFAERTATEKERSPVSFPRSDSASPCQVKNIILGAGDAVLKIADGVQTGSVVFKRNPIAEIRQQATAKARLERALNDAKRYGVSVAEIRQLMVKRLSKPTPAHGWDSTTVAPCSRSLMPTVRPPD